MSSGIIPDLASSFSLPPAFPPSYRACGAILIRRASETKSHSSSSFSAHFFVRQLHNPIFRAADTFSFSSSSFSANACGSDQKKHSKPDSVFSSQPAKNTRRRRLLERRRKILNPLLSRPPLPTCGAAAWTAKTEKPLSPCVHPSCTCAENERMSAAGSDISFRAVAVPHETRRLFVSTFAARFLIWILSQGLFVWPTATAGGKFSKNAFQMIEVFTIKLRFLVPSTPKK